MPRRTPIIGAGKKKNRTSWDPFHHGAGFLPRATDRTLRFEVLVPDEPDRETVHRVIYNELCLGKVLDPSRDLYVEILRKLADRGAEGVILGCTEIALLVGPQDSPIDVFDTTAIHAQKAVEMALDT